MYKQVIIVRKDLNWSKGKLAIHVAHASCLSMLKTDKRIVDLWMREGAKKVLLKVENLKELKNIEKNLKKNKISYCLISDMGKTQLKKGTITALGIGPLEEEKIDKITGNLKLL